MNPLDDGGLDPLKLARRELVLRQIRNEDLKIAVAEAQLMPVELHRLALSDLVSTTTTFLDTLPDVMERKFALEGVLVSGLRDLVDAARDNLHEKLREKLGTSPAALMAELEPPPQRAPKPAYVPKKRGRPSNAERAARMLAEPQS